MRQVNPLATLLLASTIIVLSSCRDGGVPMGPQEATPLAEQFSWIDASLRSAPEGQVLVEVARLVAVALGDEGLRQRIKNDLRQSPFREHKLEFSSYIREPRGGVLLAKMAQLNGTTTAEVLMLLDQIRPLEFYMPDDDHRTSWTGGPEVIVGAQLEDHTIPMGFSTSGQPYRFISAEEPASVPVLALVPVETNFSRPLEPGTYRNTRDQQGQAIGIYELISGSGPSGSIDLQDEHCPEGAIHIQTCHDGGGGGGGGIDWSTKPSGLYLTAVSFNDDYEGSLRGDPEFETHLQAPWTDLATAEDLRCAGEHAPDPLSVYDQNFLFWTGAALVADSAEQATFEARFGQEVGMTVVSWEDDDTECAIKADQNRFQDMMIAIANAYSPVDAMLRDPNTETIVKALEAVSDAVMSFANWLKSNDDVIGSRVERTCTLPNGTTGTWTVVDGNDSGTFVTGCSRIKAHKQGIT